MAYTITTLVGDTIGTIEDGTVNTSSTSLALVGRNYSNYGQVMVDDLVRLLENFANVSAPANPLIGQIWWDTDDEKLKVSVDGLSSWRVINGCTSQAAAPTNAAEGDLWWDSDDEQFSVWNGSEWVLVGPTYKKGNGKSGAIWEILYDNTISNAPHNVLAIYLDGTRRAIVSQDSEFTPNVAITGFSTIKLGTNIKSGDTVWGTANNASYLGDQPAANYLRSDVADTTAGTLGIVNDGGLTIGSGLDLQLSVDGIDAIIKNNTTGGSLAFYANVGGTSTAYITIDGTTGTVEVEANPSTSLGVATKQYVDDSFVNAELTGVPTTPTAPVGTANTQVASTGFVSAANLAMKGYVDSLNSGIEANLALKANIASPTLTGAPKSVTMPAGTGNTTIATTAFVYEANVSLKAYVDAADALKAPLASPTFTGDPRAPTPSLGDNDTSIATTAFVQAANVVMKNYVDAADALKAPLASPTLTGAPKSVTMDPGTANTTIATTSFVSAANVLMKGYVDAADTTLQSNINLKADIASPTLTGVPKSVTMPVGTANTAIATTDYVINNAGFLKNRIWAGPVQGSANTFIEVLENGTAGGTGAGSANLSIDGTSVLTATSSGVSLKAGATGTTPTQTYNATGNTWVATTQYVKSATAWWGGSAKFVSNVAPNPGVNDIGSNNGDFWFQYE